MSDIRGTQSRGEPGSSRDLGPTRKYCRTVGILFQKSIEQIAVMLGVLKAGKFFVLLDPSFPKARVESVLKDSHAELVITDRHNLLFAHELGCKDDRLMEFESIDSRLSSHNPCPAIASSRARVSRLHFRFDGTTQRRDAESQKRFAQHNAAHERDPSLRRRQNRVLGRWHCARGQQYFLRTPKWRGVIPF